MHNLFKIEDTIFRINQKLEKQFTVKSFPKNYDVVIGRADLTFGDDCVVLVDQTVGNLYNVSCDKIVEIKALEKNKSMDTCLMVCGQLSEWGFTKSNRLIVIGGGITQDIGAFVAKMFKRGINWEFYPTTLLSMCDSCIGGKSGLNFDNHKNQLALFSAPSKVTVDIEFLKTLTAEDMVSGYGEIVKLFTIGGNYYLNNISNWGIEDVIRHSLEIKRLVIEKDEFEEDLRKSLNYGHSFGHVIESMTKYKIPHGEAVLLGILLVNKLFDNNEVINEACLKFTSLCKIKQLSTVGIVSNLKSDKKVAGDVIQLVNCYEGVTNFFPTKLDDILVERLNAILAN